MPPTGLQCERQRRLPRPCKSFLRLVIHLLLPLRSCLSAINPHQQPGHCWAAAPIRHPAGTQPHSNCARTADDKLGRARVLVVTNSSSSAPPCLLFARSAHCLICSPSFATYPDDSKPTVPTPASVVPAEFSRPNSSIPPASSSPPPSLIPVRRRLKSVDPAGLCVHVTVTSKARASPRPLPSIQNTGTRSWRSLSGPAHVIGHPPKPPAAPHQLCPHAPVPAAGKGAVATGVAGGARADVAATARGGGGSA